MRERRRNILVVKSPTTSRDDCRIERKRFLQIIATATLLAGCSDKLADDAYGFIDLAPYYYDGSSVTDPTAGLPRTIAPVRGWQGGVRAEYYDFGLVGFVKKRSDGKLPDYGEVPPIYFFFDSAGRPLFSRPVFETKSGLWLMPGGAHAVLNPNPSPGGRPDVPYAARARDLLYDQDRQSYDFQRPIVDRLQHNTDYSGLWEIWEVTAPDGYQPDDIKSYQTLQKALDGGTFSARRTQTVINCPVVDDRTAVLPTALWYGVPHPRIELWYRTKQGACFLADGWMAMGDASGGLYHAGDPHRFNMFDVIAYPIGEGANQRITVRVPVQRLIVPTVTIAGQDPAKTATSIRYVNDYLTDMGPRTSPDQPPGYSPLRWLWDLKVPQDPPWEPGSFQSPDQVDPANLTNRLTSNTPFIKNFPVIGQIHACAGDADCTRDKVGAAPGMNLQCNRYPNADIATSDLPGASMAIDDPVRAATVLRREGGPRCDVPAVRFGEYCAPGVARCQIDVTGLPDAMPSIDGHPGSPMLGYTCQPTGAGYCYYRCDIDLGAGSAPKIPVTVEYGGPLGTHTKDTGTLDMDARCGNIPGYRCLNIAPKMPETPSRMRVCLRSCDPGRPDNFNDAFCRLPLKLHVNEKVDDDVQKGTTCSNRGIDPQTGVPNSTAGCQWDPAFEPRDPASNFIPK
jgi:hypothetical protein